jgi:ribosomal protein L37E
MAIPVNPDDTLARYASAWITLKCRGCGRRHELPASELAGRVGWKTTFAQSGPKMRCTRCGRRGPNVQVGWDTRPAGWRSPR